MQKEYLGGIVTFGIGLLIVLLFPHWRSLGAVIALAGLAAVTWVIWRGRRAK